MERFLRWTRPGAVRVLRFDSACGAEGCGIALAGDEYFAACGGENHTTAPSARWKCTPSAACVGVSPRESVSHDSQSPAAPYESCSLATPKALLFSEC